MKSGPGPTSRLSSPLATNSVQHQAAATNKPSCVQNPKHQAPPVVAGAWSRDRGTSDTPITAAHTPRPYLSST